MWICGICDAEVKSGTRCPTAQCRGKPVTGQGGEKKVKELPCPHSKAADKLLNPEGEEEFVSEEQQAQIDAMIANVEWAEQSDSCSPEVLTQFRKELLGLQPETNILKESEAVKNMKDVITDLSTLTGRHEQTMSSYEANIRGSRERIAGFEEKEAAKLIQLEQSISNAKAQYKALRDSEYLKILEWEEKSRIEMDSFKTL